MTYKYATLAEYPGGAETYFGVLTLMEGGPLLLMSGGPLRTMDATPGVGARSTLGSVSKGLTTLADVDDGATTLEVVR